MKRGKTPTLAELRKLAKRKGPYVVVWDRFRNATDKANTYPRIVMDVGQRSGKRGMILLATVYPKTRREGQAMLFAALSALSREGQQGEHGDLFSEDVW